MEHKLANERDLTPQKGNSGASSHKRATAQIESPTYPTEPFGRVDLTTVHGLTIDQLRVILKGLSKVNGGINNLAIANGVTGQYLGAVIAGQKNPGPKLLRALHLREITLYVPSDDPSDDPADRAHFPTPTSLNPEQETD